MYDVPTRPLGRSRRPIVLPPLVALAVVAVALITSPAPVPAPLLLATPAAPLAAALTDCGELRALSCRETVHAAQLALDPGHPPIASATAWRSLICGNDSDCPWGMLDRARPAGSVVFTFADGSVAWVNVLWLDVSSRRFEDGTERPVARVVRWFEPGA